MNSILVGLGKATRRGVRKCPKCGTVNGTRGLSCKNRSCDMVFKDPDNGLGSSCKKRQKIVCRLSRDESVVSGTVYFVKTSSRGGLVYFRENHDVDDDEDGVVVDSVHCYVDGCVNNASSSNKCSHINACLDGHNVTEAVPLTVKVSALNGMCIDDNVKHEIWLRAKDPGGGPLVQRIPGTTTMIVRDDKTYVPILFTIPSARSSPDYRCFCVESQMLIQKCFHYYACLAVFAGDEDLAKEFAVFLNLTVQNEREEQPQQAQEPLKQVIAILGEDENGDPVKVEVLGEEDFLDDHPDQLEFLNVTTLDGGGLISLNSSSFIADELPQLSTTPTSLISPPLPSLPTASLPPSLPPPSLPPLPSSSISPSPSVPSSSKRIRPPTSTITENDSQYSFIEWLAGVSERINQTMHYQFDGKPNPLVFHAPQTFFNLLRERISLGCKKKRLPNSTTAFVRKDALPIGTFTKYSWSITNVFHVKQIFDTVLMPLEVTRIFVENRDGTYELLKDKKRTSREELKTYLKVGQTSSDSKEITPFIIEWIPDILPIMKVGELRIKFEYGHLRNGQHETRKTDSSVTSNPVFGINL